MLEERRTELETHLEGLIETLRHCIIIVQQFKPEESQTVLNEKLSNGVLEKFKKLNELCQPQYDVEIPIEILDYIDEGKNPELFTKDILEKCIKSNESVKGKIEALQKFRQALEKEISATFPEHYAEYMKLKQTNTTSIMNETETNSNQILNK